MSIKRRSMLSISSRTEEGKLHSTTISLPKRYEEVEVSKEVTEWVRKHWGCCSIETLRYHINEA